MRAVPADSVDLICSLHPSFFPVSVASTASALIHYAVYLNSQAAVAWIVFVHIVWRALAGQLFNIAMLLDIWRIILSSTAAATATATKRLSLKREQNKRQ